MKDIIYKFRWCKMIHGVDFTIDKINIDKESKSYVWVRGIKCKKLSSFEVFSDTVEDAIKGYREYVKKEIECLTKKKDSIEKNMLKCRNALDNINVNIKDEE